MENISVLWMKPLEGRALSWPHGERIWSLSKPKAHGNSRKTGRHPPA